MARKTNIVKLVSTEDTGYFVTTVKNPKLGKKLDLTKYDPIARKHVKFKETKVK